MPYVELHARSAFSFLEGASLPEDLVDRAGELDLPAMALVDRGGVYGAPRFHMAAKKAGMRALIGAEVANSEGSRLTLLVENQRGYQNLCRLITRTNLREGKPGKTENAFAHDEEFAQWSAGLICLTGGEEGPLAKMFSTQAGPAAMEAAKAELGRLLLLFGERNVYVELQRHYRREQEARNQVLVEMARQFRLPVIATNGVTQAVSERRPLADALTCIREKTTIAEAGRKLNINSERHLKSDRQMRELFADVPAAVEETGALASRLAFTLEDLGYEFPRYPVPEGDTVSSFLGKRTLEGARKRYQVVTQRVQRQLERELAVIGKLNLEGYFLIVWDIVEFCRNQGILVQGRGSAANSAVCYSLGITAVDPVGMDLLFERFLSEERGEWPDIDLDLPSGDDRETAIQYVYQRYGQLGAAMTANVITYRGRSAVRDVGKVLGFEEQDLERLAGMMGRFEWRDPQDTLERRFVNAGLDPRLDPRVNLFFQLTSEILELPRHLGQHSGGMVICQGRLDQVVPLEPASMPGRVVVEWDKDDCADMGIVKVDLLGLGMMAVLKDTVQLISDQYGENVDLAQLPADDPAVYDALQRADTVGLFQVESRAQMSCLPRMMPAKFYDIVVQVAIIRPGPIVGQMLHPYLRRRQGREEPVCLHPSLEPVLRRTLGVPLFQEQLIRIAMIAAGFSGGEAEQLRRAMGFKRSEKRMREIEVKLRDGMERNGITGEPRDRIIQAISSFALYGFPESHAASFALLAYASAYLKCHYLAAFTAALLNNQPMGFYSPATIVKDAQRHGLRFRPVDVLASDYQCTIEHDALEATAKPGGELVLRLGLNYVRGLRKTTAHRMIEERCKCVFHSLRDLMRRVPELEKGEVAAMAELGALNALPEEAVDRHRRGALWQAQLALQPVGELLEPAAVDSEPSPLAPMSAMQRTYADFEHSSLSIGKHPMAYHRERMNAMGVLRAALVKEKRNGAIVKVAGCVITRQRPGTAKGFVFLSLEDETGIVNAIVQPDLFERRRQECSHSPYVVVKGILQNLDGVVSVRAADVEELRFRETVVVASHDFR
jgi:error-prone DNA polymerase